MASRKIEDLIPEMQDGVHQVIQICADQGVDLLITCTLRTLEEQAQLYARSRTQQDIINKQARLRSKGFGFLADVFNRVPLVFTGAKVTNAGPGESFHNYREAFDVVPMVNGKPQWDDKDPTIDEWAIYGAASTSVGFEWAGNWKSFKEMPHSQFRPGSNPLTTYSPEKILEIMKNNGLL